MNKIVHKALCGAGLSLIFLVTVHATAEDASEAHSSAESLGGALEEIVVTARKRSETAQTTPLGMSAFSDTQIEKQQISQLRDLQSSVPGLQFEAASEDQFNSLISLRGVATENDGQNLDPGVAVYVDGLYQGTSGTNLSDADDVSRIEVLKGPQGTLYGRNSTGGAINLYHNPPTDTFEGWVRGGVGNDHLYETSGMVNVPLIDHELELRLVGGYVHTDGFGRDYGTLNNGSPYGNVDSKNVSGTLRWAPAPGLEILFRGSYKDGKGNGYPAQLTYVVPNSLAQAELYNDLNPTAPPGSAFGCLAPGGPLQAACNAASARALALAASHGYYNGASSAVNKDSASVTTGSLTINYDLNDNLFLKSITGLLESNRTLFTDLSGSQFPLANNFRVASEHQITQEFTLNGIALNNALKYTAGLFYYAKRGPEQDGAGFLVNLVDAGVEYDSVDKARSLSPYFQATYALTPKINLTAGVRETHENNSVALNAFSLSGGQRSCGPGTDPVTCGSYESGSYSSLSYLAEADYTPIKDVMIYLKTSRGFRSGGQQESAPGEPGFGPETLTDYEVGEKSDFFNHRLRVNVDYYHSNYDGLQQNVYRAGAMPGTFISLVANAAKAEINGLEIQLAAQVLKPLTLTLEGAYTDPHYVNYYDAIEGNISSTPFPNVARWSYNAGGDYTVNFADATLDFNLNYHWQDAIHYGTAPTIVTNSFNGQIVPGITGASSYGILNGRMSLHLNQSNVDVSLWGKNLLDTHYFSYVADLSGDVGAPALGFVAAISGAPRTFGVQVTKHF